MPGRVEIHFVDAMAEPVVRAQLGRVRVGLESPLDRLFGAGQRAQLADEPLRP
jgi:hypothetical protein